ncbi:aminoacyl-tRNA hydrolase [Pontibacillus yanchengensis]|uniref:Aminoacyl-tRNA hydrolase n=2 Tax=Pontibacillus yanchengensis TaxID=462910 RepID=A0ACC7VLT9_9BACI|nr:aminoacyl-tRNA hydrolase [Pontibacillus yanchengensis]MYL35951.1 aminoacyl-tRNA hydrolase [Pontibacillus yanchengensis]MYL55787.1 aminoacyl-tRNA hydrolase [Pontibacillus yanchengensis]
MKCIIGLGNPGPKYENTRHNVGFMVIDELVRRHNWKLDKEKYKAQYTVEHVGSEKVLLIKPLTYMNLSGEAIRPLMDYYNLSIDDIVIIYDDLDLPPGKIRLRKKGGHGGHNGIRSTIDHLGTKEFPRLRFGIGRPNGPMPVPDYVLGTFQKENIPTIKESIERAADACDSWMENSFAEVMNEFNQ